jgi:hypothetical protein
MKKKEKENSEYFLERQKSFLDVYEKEVSLMENKFSLFAIDKTQVPCLLTMDIITHSKFTMNEKEFLSYKAFVQDILDGWRPPLGLEVIEGGKK